MNIDIPMSDRQYVAVGITVFDSALPKPKPYNSTAEYPAGVTTVWESSDSSVAEVVVREDGLNADIYSPGVGTAIVTVTTTDLPPDTYTVTVARSVPGSQNPTAGAPQDESPDDGSGPAPTRFNNGRAPRDGSINASDKDGYKS